MWKGLGGKTGSHRARRLLISPLTAKLSVQSRAPLWTLQQAPVLRCADCAAGPGHPGALVGHRVWRGDHMGAHHLAVTPQSCLSGCSSCRCSAWCTMAPRCGGRPLAASLPGPRCLAAALCRVLPRRRQHFLPRNDLVPPGDSSGHQQATLDDQCTTFQTHWNRPPRTQSPARARRALYH